MRFVALSVLLFLPLAAHAADKASASTQNADVPVIACGTQNASSGAGTQACVTAVQPSNGTMYQVPVLAEPVTAQSVPLKRK